MTSLFQNEDIEEVESRLFMKLLSLDEDFKLERAARDYTKEGVCTLQGDGVTYWWERVFSKDIEDMSDDEIASELDSCKDANETKLEQIKKWLDMW